MRPNPGNPWCNGVREPQMQMANATSGRNGFGQVTPSAAGPAMPPQQEQRELMLNNSSGRNGFGFTQPPPTQPANNFGFTPPPTQPANTFGFTQPAPATQPVAVFMLNQTSGRNFSTTTSFNPSAVVTHNNVTCDGGCSRGPLTGVRYKCSTCANYDLCESCMALHDKPGRTLPQECMISHPRNHYFLRIPRDVGTNPPPILVNRSNWVHHGINCAECNTPDIMGYRYFCTTCGTSFCETCEQQGLPRTTAAGVHVWSHNLLKMVPPPARASALAPAPKSGGWGGSFVGGKPF